MSSLADCLPEGHVLTRIVYKGAYALGVLHDYNEECDVLRALLAQKVWRRGKRG
jgi:Fanconi-associated nuclease 1